MAKQKAWRPPDVKQQHVGLHRKVLMRRHMLRHSVEGAAYVPFIGDGDIAQAVYSDRTIYGADLDPDRVEVARNRLRGDIRVADCDGWPFSDVGEPFAVADFDAYIEPYVSFRSFWAGAEKAERVLMFFTDGRKQGMMRTGWWTDFEGTQHHLEDRKHEVYHRYLTNYVWPWFQDFIGADGWRTVHKWRYQRAMMLYWGCAIERMR